MKNQIAETIKGHGYRVFVRNGGDSYAYYTDGNRIGYAQAGKVSTVHVPNGITGTGFLIHDGPITKAALEAGFLTAPEWASRSQVESVRKYASLDSFLEANSWGGGLVEYSPINT